ncbi:type IX secretion system membrane protein PorP/SprF [Aquiflexum sp.]|uniref:PorP/SprF family type IX secretion system membrane protein n=1 Tax=Aquiflexum sp. TaxID=1872584 RepID=UPI003593F44D
MKKSLLTLILIGAVLGSIQAQTRKYVAQFSHMQGYFNPALTGYEGSTVRGFVRNQWAGFEGAPKTYFVSAEMDFADITGNSDPLMADKNAFGINVLHDQYGAFAETELIGNYSARIQISPLTSFRLGVGVNYNMIRLDGNLLNPDQPEDPRIMQYLNGFANMQVLDFNIGGSITHPNYYISYAVHNANRGAINSGDIFMERRPRVGVFQGGYRNAMTDQLAVATNIMYRHQVGLPDNIEFNFKVLMMDRLWLGAGHRRFYANNVQLGMVFPMVRIGYVYEMPMARSYLLPNTTHEFLAVFPLFRKNIRESKDEVLIW